MKRIERIYNYISEKSKELTLNDLRKNKGFSAIEISEKLDILRNNVSMELNTLLRQDQIIKIKGRPVLYLDKLSIENLIGYKFDTGPIEIENTEELLKNIEEEKGDKSPFDHLIGADTGLKNQIEQAKAAMLYPPNGLHTLIIGQTGVGKTLFANMMYSYAKYAKRLPENAPFVVFNCADYYNNPQLLISHIFGHAKGSFTGAESEKEGLVQKANGGILFLDEIHRLPPEGQEMIFYFMDTGTFNKLGETERMRKANVLIIGATTEEPGSSLLKTFVRRIPIVISIPSLEERPVKDKLKIVKFLLSNEAHRVNKPIKIEGEAVKALIGSVSYGNIGQMKSNIQLVCAKGFLNSIENKDCIEIDFKSLPSDIKSGLFNLTGKRKEAEELSQYTDSQLVIMPEGYKMLIEEDPYEPPFNLYKIIEDKAAVLKDDGVDEDYIKKFITTDINVHIKCFYDKFKNNVTDREKILNIVHEDILSFAEEIKLLIEKRMSKKLNERFLYALSLHLSAFIKRVESNRSIRYTNIEDIIKDNHEEFNISLEIKSLIEKRYNLIVPQVELIYLTLLISTINDTQSNEHVAIIVAAHGSNTASSMVNVAKKLLGEGVIAAVDMPLEVSPKKILDEMIEKVKEVNMGKGVLLLVDMGSLVNFDTIITEKTGIIVKTIDMVSTPLVLEAVRKANIFDMDLDTIYDSLKDFKGYGRLIKGEGLNENKPKAIITICATGQGTAEKLKELVSNIVTELTDDKIEIIPVGVHQLNQIVNSIRENYYVLASVGVLDPKIEAPFISLETLIGGDGERLLASIIQNLKISVQPKQNNVVVRDLSLNSLEQFLTYLNPKKIISVLIKFIEILESELKKEFDNSTRIKLILHIGCALERMVIKEGLIFTGEVNNLNRNIINSLTKANNIFKDSLNLLLSDDEVYYIVEMIEQGLIK